MTRTKRTEPEQASAGKNEPDTDELAKEARTAHEEFVKSHNDALEHALEAGKKLLVARPHIGHGNDTKGEDAGWTKYVEERCKIPYRTARRYMYIAGNKKFWPRNSATVAEMGVTGLESHIRDAYKTKPDDIARQLQETARLSVVLSDDERAALFERFKQDFMGETEPGKERTGAAEPKRESADATA